MAKPRVFKTINQPLTLSCATCLGTKTNPKGDEPCPACDGEGYRVQTVAIDSEVKDG